MGNRDRKILGRSWASKAGHTQVGVTVSKQDKRRQGPKLRVLPDLQICIPLYTHTHTHYLIIRMYFLLKSVTGDLTGIAPVLITILFSQYFRNFCFSIIIKSEKVIFTWPPTWNPLLQLKEQNLSKAFYYSINFCSL